MKVPATRKGAASVGKPAPEESPTLSPTTWLSLDTESRDGRRKYAGKFKYRVPNMGDRVDIDTMRAQFTQQVSNVTGTGQATAEALAYLSVTIDPTTAPQWWKDSKGGIELFDFQPLLSLYALARAYEATFLGASTDSGTDEGGDGDGAAAAADSALESDLPATPQRRTVLASFGKGSDGTDPHAPRAGDDAGGTEGQSHA